MSEESIEIWTRCLLAIEQKIRKESFYTWFSPTKAIHFDKDSIVIEVPSTFFADWLEEYYLPLIQETIREQTGFSPKVTFSILEEDAPEPLTVSPALSSSSSQPRPDAPSVPAPSHPPADNALRVGSGSETSRPGGRSHTDSPSPTMLNDRYTFDTFVVGDSNQFAYAAAVAVAKAPGRTVFNPLVIYGGVGLGKTHILQAIGHYALENQTAPNVIYVPSEEFLNDFIHALQNRSVAQFTQIYRAADLLLVDDVQFLLQGEKTQHEFFHTFNTLYQNERQIVLTCDSHPGELRGLEERLTSRFQSGLVTEINPPDLETRTAILKKKAEAEGIVLPADVASFIATTIVSNIRELEGALIRLMAYCSIHKRDINMESAVGALNRVGVQPSEPDVTIEVIQRQVAEYYGIPHDLIISKTRKQEVASARQIAMYLAKSLTGSSLKTIGLHFGGRDHSTVVHACKLVERKKQTEIDFSEELNILTQSILQGAKQHL